MGIFEKLREGVGYAADWMGERWADIRHIISKGSAKDRAQYIPMLSDNIHRIMPADKVMEGGGVGCPVWMITREGAEWNPDCCSDDRMQLLHDKPYPEIGVVRPIHMTKPPLKEMEALYESWRCPR